MEPGSALRIVPGPANSIRGRDRADVVPPDAMRVAGWYEGAPSVLPRLCPTFWPLRDVPRRKAHSTRPGNPRAGFGNRRRMRGASDPRASIGDIRPGC